MKTSKDQPRLFFRILGGLLAACLLLAACGTGGHSGELYSVTYLTLFDTVTTITGCAESREAFDAQAQAIYDELLDYHRLFDIYQSYNGLNNLKTINDQAGVSPVKVDSRIIRLLKDCRAYYDLTGGKVNVAMGSVLALWHQARSAGLDDPANAALPDQAALEAAARHISIDCMIINEAESTVYLSDPDVRLDVGAVAKGWAAQRVAETAPEGLLLSVGGNVVATGPKDSSGTPWVVGIRNPDRDDYLHTLNLTDGAAVTSGDYQRCYTVDGKRYHHIIDPDTLFPAADWRSVTILCADSALADALSTALFLMPRAQGQTLLDACGAEAMWVDTAGTEYFSPGFEAFLRS